MFSIKDKRQDIRFTKQISVTRISNLPSKFHCFAYILEKRDFDWGGGKMVEWWGHHGGWGDFGPPSYIVKNALQLFVIPCSSLRLIPFTVAKKCSTLYRVNKLWPFQIAIYII